MRVRKDLGSLRSLRLLAKEREKGAGEVLSGKDSSHTVSEGMK